MNKHQISQMLATGTRQENQLNNVIEKLGGIIAESFSALANISPETALDVLEQLVDQRPSIEEFMEEQEVTLKRMTDKISAGFHFTEEE